LLAVAALGGFKPFIPDGFEGCCSCFFAVIVGFGAFSEEEGRDGDLGFFSPEHGRF